MKHAETVIIYIITELELGGAQKVCLALFNGVKKEVPTVLISSTKGILASQLPKDTTVHLLSHLQRSVGLTALLQEICAAYSIWKILRHYKKQYRHVIVHTHSTKAGLIGRVAAWCARIPIRIHTIHGYAFHAHQSWLTWTILYLPELLVSFITTHFICVSSADVKTGIRIFPGFAGKHSIIRAAIDHTPFHREACTQAPIPASAERPFIFGTVACFKPQKNMFDLLHAFHVVHEKLPHTRLEIVGDGALRTSIETWIHEHNLSHAITLHGWQSSVAPIMHRWHIFALSSLWEGLPCSIVEAQCARIPIVCYNTGGISDIVTHRVNGILVPQKQRDTLSHALYTVASSKELYNTLEHAIPDLRDFYLETMITHHLVCYQEVQRALHQKTFFFRNQQTE